jgi:hypothetical protein
MLGQTGGLSVMLKSPPRIETVTSSQGEHGWWRGGQVSKERTFSASGSRNRRSWKSYSGTAKFAQ